ncbi:MAG: hypothetical protein CBC13_00120, partial [Planctomycetia bacterium TMED53]
MLPSRSQSALAVGPEVAPPVTAAAPSRATNDTDSEQSNACIHHPQDSPGKPVSGAPGSADLTSTSAGAAPTSTRWNGTPTTSTTNVATAQVDASTLPCDPESSGFPLSETGQLVQQRSGAVGAMVAAAVNAVVANEVTRVTSTSSAAADSVNLVESQLKL